MGSIRFPIKKQFDWHHRRTPDVYETHQGGLLHCEIKYSTVLLTIIASYFYYRLFRFKSLPLPQAILKGRSL